MRELKKAIWPHKVTIKDGVAASDAEIWLGETMGIYKGRRWTFIILFGSVEFYFKDGKDAIMFALRWA